jgi:hypothetical protein
VGNAVPEEVQFIQAKKVRPSTGFKICQICFKGHTILSSKKDKFSIDVLFFTKTTYCYIRPLAAEIFFGSRFFTVSNWKVPGVPVSVVACHRVPWQRLLDSTEPARKERGMAQQSSHRRDSGYVTSYH